MDLDATDLSKLSPTARAALDALDALERCTLTEVGAIEMYHLRHVKRRVAVRTAAECAAKVAAERETGAARAMAESLGLEWTAELEAEARRQAMSGPIDAVRAEMAAAAEAQDLSAGMVDGLLVPEEDADEPDELDATPLEVVVPPTPEQIAEANAFFAAERHRDRT